MSDYPTNHEPGVEEPHVETSAEAEDRLLKEAKTKILKRYIESEKHYREPNPLLADLIRSKKPTAETETNQDVVDQEIVDSYAERDPLGPIVGEVTALNTVTGEQENLLVKAKDEDFNKERAISYVIVKGERILARCLLREQPTNFGRKFNPRGQYGNDPDNRPGTLYVDYMYTEFHDHSTRVYEGLGRALHQIAVERSLQVGYQGRVQLAVAGIKRSQWDVGEDPGFSAPFHEKFGFLAQDVYNEDGSLHHEGQSIHDKIAKDREKLERRGDFMTAFLSNHKVYMILPPEVIEREKKRIAKKPNLRVNRATTEALVKKDFPKAD